MTYITSVKCAEIVKSSFQIPQLKYHTGKLPAPGRSLKGGVVVARGRSLQRAGYGEKRDIGNPAASLKPAAARVRCQMTWRAG